MTLPPENLDPNVQAGESIRIRRCNCSTCHKMGFFHIRLKDAPRDFVLLSPLNPLENGLRNYQCFDKIRNWLFCPDCGVRCFATGTTGEWEVKEIDLEEWLGNKSEGKTTKVWRAKADGWQEGKVDTAYLSVNAITVEPGQKGFNMKEWYEKKWINYLDTKDETEDNRMGEPHEGGTY